MRRAVAVLLALSTALTLGVGVANAQSQTVAGDKYGGSFGDVRKIVVNNAAAKLTTKVFGLGEPCGGAASLQVDVQNRRGRLLYRAEGSCVGVDWGRGLYATDTGKPEDAVPVKCKKFVLARSAKSGAFRVVIPRTCMSGAPNKLRVEVNGLNFGSATGGHAGPTKALRRG
jgi:hypothetical protein